MNTPTTRDQAALGDLTTLWVHGPVGIEARGRFPSVEDYEVALDALVEVDPATFEAALPGSAVPPRARAAAVDTMLQDIPRPPGLDLDALREGNLITDRYQLGAEVTGTLTCRWIDAWVAAKDAGDTEGVQQAVDAMATSHDWQILLDMADEGHWSIGVWEYADALPTNGPIGPGDAFTVEDTYSQSFGCDPNAPAGF